MSETAKVRVVRCPKCANLLPEVTEYSVYQCGGCGAVLRAKNNGVDLETFSEKSDEERIGGSIERLSDRYEKMMNVSERRKMMDMSDGFESDVRSNISSSSRAERRRIIRDRAENNRSNLVPKEENWDVAGDAIAREVDDMVMYHENDNGLRWSSRVMDGRNGAWRMDPEVMSYAKEGPSRPVTRSDVDEFNNFDYVGDDRAELLQKLDELKDQLSRSGNLVDKGKEKVPIDRRMAQIDPYASENWYHDALSETGHPNPYPNMQFKRPPYENPYAELPPLMRRQDVGGNGFYPPVNGPSHVHPSRSHMHMRGPHQAPGLYQVPPSRAYMSGPYISSDGMGYMDAMEPYQSNFSHHHHHPSCSCYPCRTKRHVYNDQYPDVPNDRFYNHLDNSSFGSRDYNHRISNPPHRPPPLRSHNAQPHTRWPSDVKSEMDGFAPGRPPRAHLAPGGKHCRPMVGGAPFFTCYNCFELLLLPKKILAKNNNRKKKMTCGACSTVIIFAFADKKLVLSSDIEAKDDNPIEVDNKCDVPSTRSGPNQARTTFSSEDYDNSGYDFHSMDRASNSNEMKNLHSISTYTSEAEEDAESLKSTRKDANSADMSASDNAPPPLAGSSLQDYFEYSNKYHVAANSSSGEEKNKVLPNKNAGRQILRKESSATEIDLSSNEYSNTGTTFDSGEASREGDNLKGGRGAESFFAGIIKKKSFKDSSKSSDENFEQEKASVTVNGHLIPDRLIKKAEKLAGQIHPGHYWYDFRAGFWGAIGGPCLGIIPPFIEEFNYPMSEHCAGGNTHVFVNGRELNMKDLNLLGSRGLPTERDRSYIIEISGRVLDEDTGEELTSLGKLAPTVERLKHGFGMKAPTGAA